MRSSKATSEQRHLEW